MVDKMICRGNCNIYFIVGNIIVKIILFKTAQIAINVLKFVDLYIVLFLKSQF